MIDSHTSHEIKVTCPYCGNQFTVEPPAINNNGDSWQPFEVECVPYSRDIGRFDPKDEASWLSGSGWSRIGRDYLSVISYEKIGILRIDDTSINIYYRVQGCPECHNLFDVYANYTYKDGTPKPLKSIWSHVFGTHERSPSEIILYKGESWPIWLTNVFSRFFGHSHIAGSILLCVLLFCFGLIPWLLVKPADQWGLFLVETLLHFVAVASVCLVLIISTHYIKYLNNTTDFYDALDVREHRSVHHWLNYTRCRIVGVQGKHRHPQLTQVDIFAGGGGVLSLLFVWAVVNHNWLVGGLGLLLLLGILLIFIDKRIFTQRRISFSNVSDWIKPILVIGALLTIIVIWLIVRPNLSWTALNQTIDLIFWILVAYLLGTGTLFTESIASYVLTTLSRIPIRLNPFDKYAQIKPLRRIQAYSTWTIFILFLTIIFIAGIILTFRNFPINDLNVSSAFRQASIQWNWLVIWISLALALIFGGLGVGKGKISILVLSVFYLVLYFLALSWNPRIEIGPINLNFLSPSLTTQKILINFQGQLIVVGVFLTYLLIQHLVSTDRIISKIIEGARKKYLHSIDQQISAVNFHMQKYNDAFEKSEDAGINELHKNASTLNELLQLRTLVEKSRDRPSFRRLQLLSPIMTSLIFPTILEGIIYPLVG